MVILDTSTAFFVSTVITAASSIAILLFSLSRKENRLFLWGALASSSLAGTLWLISLRGKVPDSLSIVLANELGVLSTVAFYEIYCRLLAVRGKGQLVGPVLLVIQFGLLLFFTYQTPDFAARVIITSSALGIMSIHVMKLLVNHAPKKHYLSYFFAAIPFIMIMLVSVLRIIPIIMGTQIAETSYESPAFAFYAAFYGIVSVWSTIGVIFIMSNKLHSEISEIAMLDPLTRVYNRRSLNDAVAREMSRAKRLGVSLSVIITDIDHFKHVNDSYGHQAGDAILVHLVTLYKKFLRTEDILVRYGGEEFLVLLPGINLEGAYSVAERLREICKQEPLVFENHPIPVTSSYGVASYDDGPMSFDAILKKADEALYRAKKEGRDRVIAVK